MNNISEKQLETLQINICQQANYFLTEAGEFYPFGVVFDKDFNLKPVGAFLGDEFPETVTVLNFLEGAIKKGIANQEYLAGAVGVDVNIKNAQEVQSALEIRTFVNDKTFKNYFLYFKSGEDYSFKKIEDLSNSGPSL